MCLMMGLTNMNNMRLLKILTVIGLSLWSLTSCNEKAPEKPKQVEKKYPETLDLKDYAWDEMIPEEYLGKYKSLEDNLTAYTHNCLVAVNVLECSVTVYEDAYYYPRTLKGDGTDTDEEVEAAIKSYYVQLDKALIWSRICGKMLDDEVKKDLYCLIKYIPCLRVCRNYPDVREFYTYNSKTKVMEDKYVKIQEAYIKEHWHKRDEIRSQLRYAYHIQNKSYLKDFEAKVDRARGDGE